MAIAPQPHTRQRPPTPARPPTPPSGPRSRRASARGFTLLEVLTVVGILALLTVMAVIGFRVVGGAGKARVTSVALENCKGLVEEYKLTTSVTGLLDTGGPPPVGVPKSTMYKITESAGPQRWLAIDSTTNSPRVTDVTNAVAFAPGTRPSYNTDTTTYVAETDGDVRAVREHYLRDETARVIKRLMAVPANRKSIEGMSADRVVKVRLPVDPLTVLATSPGIPPEYPLTPVANFMEGVTLVDGDSQPIYFIPGGGLKGVNIGYKGVGERVVKANYDRPSQTIRAPDQQPFWASPGPDGDLTTGDDNVYSFGG